MHSKNFRPVSPKSRNRRFVDLVALGAVVGLIGLVAPCDSAAQVADRAGAFQASPNAGPGSVIVHPKFGGLIFGFDLDPNGGEGILSEAAEQADVTIIAAVETFDPATGKIIKIVAKTQTQDDFVTLGINGTSVGLVEREHVASTFQVQRTYNVLNPVG